MDIVIVLPDSLGSEKTEYFFKINDKYSSYPYGTATFKQEAQNAIYQSKVMVPRTVTNNSTFVKVYELSIDQGEIVRRFIGEYSVSIPYRPMTDEEYRKEVNSILEGIPKDFADFLESRAYDSGHSAGYEEVVSILNGLVADFKPALEKFLKAKCWADVL